MFKRSITSHVTRSLLAAALIAVLLDGAPLAINAQQQQQSPAGQTQGSTAPLPPPPPPPQQQQKQQQQQDEPDAGEFVDDDDVLTVEADLTNVLFTAIDKNRRFIIDLKPEDVRLYEDNVAQEISSFRQQADLPLSLAIVIDTSGSQERTLPEEKAAARAFIDSVLRPRKDEAAVVTFTADTTLEQGLTGNVQRVRRGVDNVRYTPPSGVVSGRVPGTPPIFQSNAGGTAVWDAVYVTSKEVLSEAPERTRRAIILLTDGVDYNSRVRLNEAVQEAVRAEAVVFAIGIGDDYVDGVDKGALRKVAERTGGRAYFPDSSTELQAAFREIERELRQQYLVSYTSTNKKRDGTFRKIRMEVINPELRKQKLKLTYREGYFAKTAEGGQTAAASGR